MWVLLAGTSSEDHARVIRRHGRVGATVELRVEAECLHDKVIGAWLRCGHAFGLLRSWKRIGYVRSAHAAQWAWQLDAGLLQVEHAFVSDSCIANDPALPNVSIQIEFRRA